MKILFKLILIVGVSLSLVLPAVAIEFFDINKPKIEKLNLSINKTGDSDLKAAKAFTLGGKHVGKYFTDDAIELYQR